MKQNYTPNDLARLVLRKLKGTKAQLNNLKEKHLKELFETLFYTSLKTEEAQYIKVTITFLDPQNPKPITKRNHLNSWKSIGFDSPIPFNIKNLVKLSKAADPWSSSLAIYFDKNDDLIIWGMIDQQVHYQSFLNYETSQKPEQPGLFQSTITGIGSLVVIFDYELIATLKQNSLIRHYINVFNYGEISNRLKEFTSERIQKTIDFIKNKFPTENSKQYKPYTEKIVISTLSRILLSIQNYKHGGALLITSTFNKGLNIKHKLDYNRLSEAIDNHIQTYFDDSIYSEKNISHLEKKDNNGNILYDSIKDMDYIDEMLAKFDHFEAKDQLKGCIRFISSLSCIDGLVVLSQDLTLKGFGAIIIEKDLPDKIYISKTASVNKTKLIETNPKHFGTRHQSMFSYCYKNPASIGFVISQDGDIRAIMNINSKIIVWENIKVQQFIKNNNLRRIMTSKDVKKE